MEHPHTDSSAPITQTTDVSILDIISGIEAANEDGEVDTQTPSKETNRPGASFLAKSSLTVWALNR